MVGGGLQELLRGLPGGAYAVLTFNITPHDHCELNVKIFEKEGFNEEKIQEFGGKLMAWLIMHVGKMDQMIGEYAKSKGGEA